MNQKFTKGMVGAMQTPLDRLSSADGIIAAVLVRGASAETAVSAKSSVPKDKWQEMFTALTAVLAAAKSFGEKDLRVVLGDYTMTVAQYDEGVLGVATILGHPVAKSLRRMMSRSMKSLSKPSRASSPALPDSPAQPDSLGI